MSQCGINEEIKGVLYDDSNVLDRQGNIEIINRLGKRKITHVIHDIDGTHSLIGSFEVCARGKYDIYKKLRLLSLGEEAHAN